MRIENVNELANILRTKSQIPNQYFEIADLVLFNESSNEDLTHYHQEYSVYKVQPNGNLNKFESITVTMYENNEELAEQLNKYINTSFNELEYFSGNIITVEQFEKYKRDFEELARNY